MNLAFFRTKGNRYSIAALLGALEDLETKLAIIDKPEKLFELPDNFYIALSFMSSEAPDQINLAKELIRKEYRVIAGGSHASARPLKLLKYGFYAVFTGEAEETLRSFIKEPRPGLWRPSSPIILDNFPPFSLKYKAFSPIEITRGCPFRCAYCQTPRLFGNKVRHRSLEKILEFARKSVAHGRKVARFISPNAFGYGSNNGISPNPDAIEKLLKGIREAGMREVYFGSFPSDVRPESVTEEVLDLVKAYCNNKTIVIGLQSGSERVLSLLRRGHSIEKALYAIELISKKGFVPYVDMIFGFPFETEEDVQKSLELSLFMHEKFGAVIHAHTFMPLPGTPFENLTAHISPGTLKLLGRFSSKGIIKGQWQKQVDISAEISSLEE
ncbi:radical SAM protein [Kosmotoga arenicorallina S304]|uniref:Radical SAM protein n=1 Tax=Kosmotoga arenicorallina S304 TaxID=1453497 RepID=A0A182C7A4_9BACT|nr:TIGR04013 family B12-binding domain/radical SAM domain-containing protein [Kosmotoga arenicorallina]OAA31367.1 radical SAM protein [Kosmotoga arenicorallina S304]